MIKSSVVAHDGTDSSRTTEDLALEIAKDRDTTLVDVGVPADHPPGKEIVVAFDGSLQSSQACRRSAARRPLHRCPVPLFVHY